MTMMKNHQLDNCQYKTRYTYAYWKCCCVNFNVPLDPDDASFAMLVTPYLSQYYQVWELHSRLLLLSLLLQLL